MIYRIEALDREGGTRATIELPAGATVQDVGRAIILRVPDTMHLNDQVSLGERLRVALGKRGPLVFVVPDYVVACRLVPQEDNEA